MIKFFLVAIILCKTKIKTPQYILLRYFNINTVETSSSIYFLFFTKMQYTNTFKVISWNECLNYIGNDFKFPKMLIYLFNMPL